MTTTSSISVRSNSFLSRDVVVFAFHTRSEIGPEREEAAALLLGDRAPGARSRAREIGLRGLQRLQGFFPLALEAARHETVFGIDGAIAALGALGFVARAFRREPPWLERRLAIRLESLGGGEAAVSLAGSSAAMKAFVTASSIWTPPTLRQKTPRPSTSVLPEQ